MAVLVLFLVVVASLVVIASGVWVAVALIGAICVRPSTPSKQNQSEPEDMD
jgi:hypothetical protein